MEDSAILTHINELVDEEKRLRAAHHGLTSEDRTRLRQVEEELDQYWDLLRQRRAREEAGTDPEQAAERPAGEVEGYLQ